jgi:hypothetical protein
MLTCLYKKNGTFFESNDRGDTVPKMHRDDAIDSNAEADRLIRGMYAGKVAWAARERARELKLGAAFATVREDDDATAALYRLIYGLNARNRLTTIEPVSPRIGLQAGNTGLDALLHFARFHNRWQRDPEDWTPDANDSFGQVGSLARHLFARYPLPRFLDAAWLSGFGECAEACREWFAHLGEGGKLEAIAFPLSMTHRAAHHFLLAPDEFSIPAALRYGQIRAFGGRESLAWAVAETFLSDLQPDEPFWLSVLHFFINYPEIPARQVGPILDYIRFRKFGGSGNGSDAPEPRFSIKGRTPIALLARMEEWHEALARMGRKTQQAWESSGMAPLERIEKDSLSAATCHWRIVELTDSLSLLEEGRDMRHCVRSYQDGCVKGEKSIWSLRLTLSDNPNVPRRLLTIEVNHHRRAIVQIRGKCNQTLGGMRGNRRMILARDVLRDWARQQHLGIACSL